MPLRLSAGYQLRALFRKVPASLIPRPEPPRRLTPQDACDNYRFVLDDDEHGRDDPAELMHRVRTGVKPMATFVIRRAGKTVSSLRAVKGAATALGLDWHAFHIRGGRQEAVVLQKGAKLADFYDPEEVIARYRAAGIELDPAIFTAPLASLARPLVHADFAAHLRLVVTGLCLGYPIHETLECIRSEQKKA
jgi:hypothetical protein